MSNDVHVTQREFEFPDNATLMSTTDTRSHITYANAAFVEVSGFGRAEIQGKPHNVVRHPDMPKEAFADMWRTLKGGEPWTALVKNRRKNGDHYWVRANAMPVRRNGHAVGYMSVRTKASREEITFAEGLYEAFREGRAGRLRFHKGLIVRGGSLGWLSAFRLMPVRWRIRSALLCTVPVTVMGAFASGLTGVPLLGFAALNGIVAALATCWLEAQVSRPLEQVCEQALRVASGESQKAVHMNRVDEIGMTLRTISQLGLMFRWLIDDVSEQVLNVEAASNDIAQGNSDLSGRTERASSNVRQTAAAMTQMTTSVQSNAETASQADALSSSASDAATRGSRAVAEVVATMSEITRSSHKIADIIGVIDMIAFQTNILALNAAVEAARAGDQGRGFGVVAAEVRSLAQRSAVAAKEIKQLIGASVEKVESGSRLVDDAGKIMDDIVVKVRRVSNLMAEISSATTEQSSDIGEIDQSVGELDQITQQNASLVEIGTHASQSLKQQASRLVEAVSVFR